MITFKYSNIFTSNHSNQNKEQLSNLVQEYNTKWWQKQLAKNGTAGT
jgi:ABC-type metal ion transport system substrate-binding protein